MTPSGERGTLTVSRFVQQSHGMGQDKKVCPFIILDITVRN
ncbi:MAG: hypothetical protein ACJA1E_000417 [Paracoccaceae bacterium]|jgi:hypothetical protein